MTADCGVKREAELVLEFAEGTASSRRTMRPGRSASARHRSSGMAFAIGPARTPSRHSAMARAAIFSSRALAAQRFGNGTSQPMSHSPPLSRKRVSWKLSIAQRMAAQVDGASQTDAGHQAGRARSRAAWCAHDAVSAASAPLRAAPGRPATDARSCPARVRATSRATSFRPAPWRSRRCSSSAAGVARQVSVTQPLVGLEHDGVEHAPCRLVAAAASEERHRQLAARAALKRAQPLGREVGAAPPPAAPAG